MIKAIPTVYKGIEFRSKLEAQWAATLDALEVPWLYEVEGYQLSDGTRYLPDFYLPDSDQFFEVKGVMTDKDMHKIEQLNKDSGKDVVIGYPDGHVQMRYLDEWCAWDYTLTDRDDTVLAKCRSCGKQWFLSGQGWYKCKCCGEYDGDHHLIGWVENEPWKGFVDKWDYHLASEAAPRGADSRWNPYGKCWDNWVPDPNAYKSYIMAAFNHSRIKIIPKG